MCCFSEKAASSLRQTQTQLLYIGTDCDDKVRATARRNTPPEPCRYNRPASDDSEFLLSKYNNTPEPVVISLPLQVLSRCGKALMFINHSLFILQPRYGGDEHSGSLQPLPSHITAVSPARRDSQRKFQVSDFFLVNLHLLEVLWWDLAPHGHNEAVRELQYHDN